MAVYIKSGHAAEKVNITLERVNHGFLDDAAWASYTQWGKLVESGRQRWMPRCEFTSGKDKSLGPLTSGSFPEQMRGEYELCLTF
jgi:hypothetical protein